MACHNGGQRDRGRLPIRQPLLVDQVKITVHPGHLVGSEMVGAVVIWCGAMKRKSPVNYHGWGLNTPSTFKSNPMVGNNSVYCKHLTTGGEITPSEPNSNVFLMNIFRLHESKYGYIRQLSGLTELFWIKMTKTVTPFCYKDTVTHRSRGEHRACCHSDAKIRHSLIDLI